ncbi:WW domain-containing adapter protein with coiled-coil-like [Anneissia japonica]|uniref:WW domain-containing adapter protein with coiled-coil-like n=1 Tax=Anneissia japonica TaxID=1529436 RepID=UPI001425BA86|nr:WW domain-containing adapter protein with coiled-coil-like [Anneissia japonica]
MVMHARKIARLTDGYNEKLETHPLQAVDKLLSKKNGNGQHGNISRDQAKDGDLSSISESPNCRPGSESNSPRTFKNKASFMQKQRERQRGTSTGSSPAENSHNNQAASNSTEHSKNSAHEKKIKEILAKAHQWTEHISSSGKKYYYNCKTEVSQWEIPKEWLEREKLHKMVYASKDKISVKQASGTSISVNSNSSSKSGETKHSTETNTLGGYIRERPSLSSSSSNKISGKLPDKQPSSTSQPRSGSTTPSTPNTPNLKTRFSSSEQSNNNRGGEIAQKDSIRGMDMLRGSSLSLATDAHGRLKNLVANAPRIERIECKRASSVSPGTPSPGSSQRNHLPNQHSQPMAVVHQKIASSSCSPSVDKPNIVDSKIEEGQDRLSNPSPLSAASVSDLTSPVSHMSPRQQASVTPLSSSAVNATSQVSPNSKRPDMKVNSSPSSIRKSSPTVDESTKGSSSSNSTIPVLEEPILTKEQPLPTLTPSLARQCDESLVVHVAGWPSEHMERQARKINDESHLLAAESASQVSVDLKYARSLVRASEIQVTLQEQRLHFLQQQVKELERLKSENAFMS